MKVLRRILVIEDQENDVDLLREALKRGNVANEVVFARDGEEALEFLYRRGRYAGRVDGHPVFILLDLNLPKVTGLEILQRIKIDPDLKNIPVILLTASIQESDMIKAYERGVNSYIVKPVDFREFVETVSRLAVYWSSMNQNPLRSGFITRPDPEEAVK